MVRSLIRKEFQEHGGLFFGILALDFLVLAVSIVMARLGENILFIPRVTLLLEGTLFASSLLVADRLFAHEFRGVPRRFLDALPVSHARWMGVKFAFGLAWMLAFALLGSGGTLLAFPKSIPITAELRLLFTGNLLVLASAAFTLAVCFSCLGRFRWPVFLIGFDLFMGWMMKNDARMNESMTLKFLRGDLFLDRPDLFLTCGRWALILSAGAFAVAAALTTLRRGRYAAALALPMSRSGKVASAAVVLAVLVGVIYWAGERDKPFALGEAAWSRREGFRVAVAASGNSAELQRLAGEIGSSMDELRRFLLLPALPDLYLFVREELPSGAFETAPRLTRREAVCLVLHPDTWRRNRRAFLAFAVEELLSKQTAGRTQLEPARWLWTGFALWWADRATGAPPQDSRMLRALAAGESVSDAGLASWNRTRMRTGFAEGDALAWTGFLVLVERVGEKAVRAFLEAQARKLERPDFSHWRADHRNPLPKRIAALTGRPWPEFLDQWNAFLKAQRPRHRAELEGLPSWKQTLAPVPLSTHAWGLRLTLTDLRGTAGEAPVTFHHVPLSDWSDEWTAGSVRSEEIPARLLAAPLTLDGAFPPGARIAWRVSVPSAALDGERSLGWQILEFPR